ANGDLRQPLSYLRRALAPFFVRFPVILFHGRFLSAPRVRSIGSLTASRMEPAFSFHLRVKVLSPLQRNPANRQRRRPALIPLRRRAGRSHVRGLIPGWNSIPGSA